MKKVILMSSLLLATLVVGTHQVSAANSDTKENKASVTLTTSTDSTSLLKITNASDLNFGSKEIGIDDLMFTDENSPSITITDIRGEAKGWNVTASLGEFKDSSKNNQTLKGVQLFYPTVTMTTNSTVDVDKRTPQATETDESFSDSSIKGVLLDASATSSPKVLLNAATEKGNGQWTATYGSDHKVELKVPAGNLAGSYTAALTYTLADVPAS